MENHTLPLQERIQDPVFRRAVELLDAGDVPDLTSYLRSHPNLVRERMVFDEQRSAVSTQRPATPSYEASKPRSSGAEDSFEYFKNPSLLEFVAENPVRNGKLPVNIVEVARVILDAGAKDDQAMLDSALGLVCAGRLPRECGVQIALIDLLCDYGADPNRGMPGAHGEFEAAEALLRRGARFDLAVAAVLGRVADARRLLPGAYATRFLM